MKPSCASRETKSRSLLTHFFYVDAKGYEPGGGHLEIPTDIAERNELTVELHRV
jgi:hypothetical protein